MSKYIRGIGKSFGVQPRAASNPASAQMSEPEIWNYEPEVGSSEYLSLRTRALRYRSLVPSMLYATTCCRPETAFAISKLSSDHLVVRPEGPSAEGPIVLESSSIL